MTPNWITAAGSAVARRKVEIGRSTVALADQVLQSALTLAVTIVLARGLDPEEFGYYTWSFVVVLLGCALPDAVVTAPHSVIGARLRGRQFVHHTSTAMFLTLVMSMVLSGLVLSVGLVVTGSGQGAALAVAFVAMILLLRQSQDFLRRSLQVRNAWSRSLAVTVFSVSSHVLALAVVASRGHLTLTSALAAWAASCGSSAVVAGVLCGKSAWPRPHTKDIRQILVSGRWIGGSSIAIIAGAQGLNVIMPAVIGPLAFGQFRALVQLAAVLEIPSKALSNYLRPYLSRQAMVSSTRVQRTVRALQLYGAILFAVVSAILATFAVDLLRAIYGPGYDGAAYLAFPVFLAPLLLYWRVVYTSAILATCPEPRQLMFSSIVGSLAALVIGVPVIMVLGLSGAIFPAYSFGIASCCWLYVAWRKISTSGQLKARY